MARVPDGDKGAAGGLCLVAAEGHRERGNVVPEAVMAVDDCSRGQVDDDLGLCIAGDCAGAQQRQVVVEHYDSVRVEAAPVGIVEAGCGRVGSVRGGAGRAQDRARPLQQPVGTHRCGGRTLSAHAPVPPGLLDAGRARGRDARAEARTRL